MALVSGFVMAVSVAHEGKTPVVRASFPAELGGTAAPHPQALVLPDGQITLLLGPVPPAKIFRLARRANQRYQLAPSFPGKRGVSRSSRTREGMRWTRQRRRAEVSHGGFVGGEPQRAG